jgi:hypothetical protein
MSFVLYTRSGIATSLFQKGFAAFFNIDTNVSIHNSPYALFIVVTGKSNLCCGKVFSTWQ